VLILPLQQTPVLSNNIQIVSLSYESLFIFSLSFFVHH
jgi:hypothetical protein